MHVSQIKQQQKIMLWHALFIQLEHVLISRTWQKTNTPANKKASILQKQLMQLSQNIVGVNVSVLSK